MPLAFTQENFLVRKENCFRRMLNSRIYSRKMFKTVCNKDYKFLRSVRTFNTIDASSLQLTISALCYLQPTRERDNVCGL